MSSSAAALVDFWYDRTPDDWADIPAAVHGRTLFSLQYRRLIETRFVTFSESGAVIPDPDARPQWRRRRG